MRRRVVVSGRVQGVYFRDSCRRFAQRLGLDGWVRNRQDGTVEAVFQGEALDVDDAVAWCRSGPPSASVIDIRVTDEAVIAERPFRIET